MLADRPGTPGRRQHMPRTISSITTPASLASYKLLDDADVSTRLLSLAQMPAGLPARACLDLVVDQAVQLRPHGQRRHADLFEVRRLDVAGDIVEHLRGVTRQQRVGGEERQVGVDARRRRVVIAGAEMDIGADAARPPAAPPSTAWRGSSIRRSHRRPEPRRARAAAAHFRFCSSSKRAFSSMTAVTDLPASAASISARTIGEFLPARYSVCLIAMTSGSGGGLLEERRAPPRSSRTDGGQRCPWRGSRRRRRRRVRGCAPESAAL